MSADLQSADQRFAAFRHGAFLRYWSARFLTTFAAQIVSVAVGWQVYDLTRRSVRSRLGRDRPVCAVLAAGAGHRCRRRPLRPPPDHGDGRPARSAVRAVTAGARPARPDRSGRIFAMLALFGVARAFFSAGLRLAGRQSRAGRRISPMRSPGIPRPGRWRRSSARSPAACSTACRRERRLWGRRRADGGARRCSSCRSRSRRSGPRPTSRRCRNAVRRLPLHLAREGACSARSRSTCSRCCLGGASALLPVYARDILELGPWGLGLLRSAPGIGAIVVAVWLAGHPITDHAGRIMFVVRRAVRRLHRRVRRCRPSPGCRSRAGLARRGRHGQRLRPRDADPAVDAGRGARPRQCRQHGVRRRLQRGRRVPRRHDGGAASAPCRRWCSAASARWRWRGSGRALFPELRKIRHLDGRG